MFQEPNSFTDADHFFFEAGQDLEKVCNAPKVKDGVFKVIELRSGNVNLIYVGFSKYRGLYNEIVNGLHNDNTPRKTAWNQQIIKDRTSAIDIYWYVTDAQEETQIEMIKNYFSYTGKLSKWNKFK